MPTPTQPNETNNIGHYIQKVADLEVAVKGLQDSLQTTSAKLADAEQVVDALSQQPPAEAGFSVNFVLLSPDGAPHQFTFRGARSTDWKAVWLDRKEFIDVATSGKWKFNIPEKAPAMVPVAQTAKESGPEAAKKVQTAMADAANKPLASGEQLARICKVAIAQGKTPDRMTVNLYADASHRYADFSVQNWPADKGLALLGAVMDTKGLVAKIEGSNQVVVMPKEYAIDCLAVWKEGQAYTAKDGKPGHYKDVTELRPLA